MIYAIQSSQPPGGERRTGFSFPGRLMVWSLEVGLFPSKSGDVTTKIFIFFPSSFFVFLFLNF